MKEQTINNFIEERGDSVSLLREERNLLIGILNTLSESRSIDEYLERLVKHLQIYSECNCVGIRLLDEEGNIPYARYTGFSHEFYLSESPLCISIDKCVCVYVVTEAVDTSLPFYTEGGSFYTGSTTGLLSSPVKGRIGQTRNVCHQYGYESVALIPMKHKGKILGLIHLADEARDKILSEKVQFLEQVGTYIGEAMHTFIAEKALRDSEEHYSALVGSLADAVFQIKEGVITWCNDTVERIYGYRKEKLIGHEASLLYPEDISPSEFTRMVSSALSSEGIFCSSTEFQKGDGNLVNVEYTISKIPATHPIELIAVARDVTEREKALKSLHDSEERYTLAQRAANIGSWDWDILTGDLQWSEQIEPMFGFARGEFGATYEAFLDCIHPDDRRYVEDSVNAAVEKNKDYDIEHRIVWPDGTVHWVSEKGEVFRDGNGKGIRMLGIVQDITERKYAEQALRESEANYRTLVEFSPDGVLSVDSDVRIIDCNVGVCQLLGYSREELTGKDIRELLPNPVPEDPMPYRKQLIEDGLIETEVELVRNDGQTLPVWAKVVGVRDQKGDLSQALVYIRDIAQRKKLDQLKDEFIGLVSHELRSPLTVVIGAVNTALTERERLSPEETHQLLQDAASEAESLSHLLGNLLELSRVQADRLLLYVEPINVGNIIQTVVEKIKQYHPRHRFAIDLPKRIPQVPADQLRVERILYNLLENAAKYSPPDSEIRIHAKEDKEYLAIGVTDQGKGIPAQDQAKIFGPFQRLEYSASTGVKGIGLGLLVCRRLVEAHGGRIWMESKPGQGTTFFFALPLEQKTAK